MFLNVETKQVYVKGGAGKLGDGGMSRRAFKLEEIILNIRSYFL